MQGWYRAIAAAIGWFAIVLQYFITLRYKTDGDYLAALIRLLAYFTMLTNILVALAMTMPWLAPQSKLGAFLTRPSVRTAIASYIIVVSAVYYTVLRKLAHPQGWSLVTDTIEHGIVPVLYVLDWLLFVPKQGLSAKSVPWWLIYPVCYAAYSLLHGALTGFYPYPFLDVTKLGYERVLQNMGLLTMIFAVLGLVLLGIARIFASAETARAP
jgi:hypothetical protein